MLRRIDRVLVRVPSLPGAVRYYRDVLGMTLLRQEPRLASFRCADGITEIVLHTDPDLPDGAAYWLVDDVQDLYRRRAPLQLTFTSPPVKVSRGYRATVRDPFGTVLLLLDRAVEDPHAPIEDGKPPDGALFADVDSRVPANAELLIRLYTRTGRTADDLPYTPHFESLYGAYAAAFPDPKPSRRETWRHLLNLRKRAGRLPRLGEARSRPPELSDDAKRLLRQMLGDDIGRRDRLPYSERFDRLVDEFNTTQPRPLSPHLVWRLVATLAK